MKKIIVLALAAACAAPVLAADFYVGADVGRNRFDDEGLKLNKTGLSVFGGYVISNNIAIEAGYRRLVDGTATFGATKVDIDAHALQLSGVFSVPVATDLSLFGRLGINNIKIKASSNAARASDNETKALFGIGARYAVSPQVGLRVEYQKPASDFSVISAGVDIRF
ncbi:outer membrane beta-barrel protein [Roseateles toxinivorans]|uniref:Opacity protein-like surface antigen n=1 Tax=Roseateles toxinivorans TaxID=270368 RepID=A0A4R6QKY3_9BURK|nr:outer membrane beta-barrel protein [Roseateles toxinivorans]TDP63229.1 opacity protein-like surface antigen [Roseateles toxinivorans]